MEISVGDEFDSFECLKLKVEEIECIFNYTFVTENSNTVESGPYDRCLRSAWDMPTIEYAIAFTKNLNDCNKQVKCEK